MPAQHRSSHSTRPRRRTESLAHPGTCRGITSSLLLLGEETQRGGTIGIAPEYDERFEASVCERIPRTSLRTCVRFAVLLGLILADRVPAIGQNIDSRTVRGRVRV